MPRARAAAVTSLAKALVADPAIFSPGASLEAAITKLRALPGIGEWTAQYIAMRELREPDAFPAADIGLMRALAMPMAAARHPPSCWRLRNAGGPGAPMPRCICGHLDLVIPFHQRRFEMSVKPPETFHLDRFKTPIGIALLVTDTGGALRALDWEDYEPRMRQLLRLHYGAVVLVDARAPEPIRDALARYFAGDLDRLNAIKWHVRRYAVSTQRLDRAADHSRPAPP